MSFQFEVNTKIYAGKHEALNIKKYLKDNNIKSPFLVIDRAVFNTEYGKDFIEKADLDAILVYSEAEPTYELLESYREETNKTKSKAVIGLGGGSVMDFAKGLAFLATNKKPALEYRGFPTGHKKPLPIVTIPTTAGTGSEVTYNAVFINAQTQQKLGINTKDCFPTFSILDPVFIQSCPKPVIVSSGLDALTHAIESYGATKANDITRAMSHKAMELILFWLGMIKSIKNDIMIAEKLQYGAYLAGMALMNSGSGPSGALSYYLGPRFNVPHGLAGAIFLPYVTEYNEANGVKYPKFNPEYVGGLTYDIFDLYDKLNFDYKTLEHFGVTKDNLPKLLEGIEKLQPAFDQNPVPFKTKNAENIIRRLMQ